MCWTGLAARLGRSLKPLEVTNHCEGQTSQELSLTQQLTLYENVHERVPGVNELGDTSPAAPTSAWVLDAALLVELVAYSSRS